MPLELQIIRASEFIRLGAHGHLNLAASREMLRQLARACWLRGINQALLDVRDVHPGSTPMLTSKDLEALVNAFCKMGFSDKLRLAVLYSVDPHRRARQFAFMTTLRGWNVKASESFEEALFWLSQGTRAENRKEAGEQEIPIQVKGAVSIPPEQAQPPSDRHRPPSATPTRASTRRKPKAGRSRA